MKNTGKLLDFIGQSILITVLGLVGIGCAVALFYIFAWPGVFLGGPPLPFRIFSGIVVGLAIIGFVIGAIRIIWSLYKEYQHKSS